MKKLYSLGIILLFWVQSTSPLTRNELDTVFKKLDMDIPIRVLLDERGHAVPFSWKLTSPGGFVIFEPQEKLKTVFYAQQLIINNAGNFLFNGTEHRGEHLFILPIQGAITFRGNMYDGIFALTRYQGVVHVVNHVDLEDYVLSVLPYESWTGWPDEVQRAFCIMFRSYGIAKVLERRAAHQRSGHAKPYDIKNTNAHQIYKGRHKVSYFKKIVDDTQSIVIAHKQKPILAMFDICCGGIVPARKTGLNFGKAPYLARTYPCQFCKDYKFYRWNVEYSFDEIERGLKKEFPHMGMLRDIRISSQDQAGVAREIKFRGSHQWYTMGSSKFKSLFKKIRSLCFNFDRMGRNLVIEGRGYGHLVGLCQRGTASMVKQGWNYRNILKFYYPYTSLMKLQKIKY